MAQITDLATDEAVEKWWAGLAVDTQIIQALQVMQDSGVTDGYEYIRAAEKPWKWKREAYILAQRIDRGEA